MNGVCKPYTRCMCKGLSLLFVDKSTLGSSRTFWLWARRWLMSPDSQSLPHGPRLPLEMSPKKTSES